MNWNLMVTGVLYLGVGTVLLALLKLMDGVVTRFIPTLRQPKESQAHQGALDGLYIDVGCPGVDVSPQAVSETCATALGEHCSSTQVIEGGAEIISGLVDGL